MPKIYVLSKNKKNIKKFHLKINIFFNREILLYIAWACFRNVLSFWSDRYAQSVDPDQSAPRSRSSLFVFLSASFGCVLCMVNPLL